MDAQEALALVLTGAMLTRAGYGARSRPGRTAGNHLHPDGRAGGAKARRPDAAADESSEETAGPRSADEDQ